MYPKKKKKLGCTNCIGDISSVSASIGFLANTIKKLKIAKKLKNKLLKNILFNLIN